MISNPVKIWLNGNEKEFTYEGGTELYHFDCSGDKPDDIRTGWTGSWIPVNIIFFANSIDHARDVLKRMLEFKLSQTYSTDLYWMKEKENKAINMYEDWLSKIDKAVITIAPKNQMYSVGWASNDTIF